MGDERRGWFVQRLFRRDDDTSGEQEKGKETDLHTTLHSRGDAVNCSQPCKYAPSSVQTPVSCTRKTRPLR